MTLPELLKFNIGNFPCNKINLISRKYYSLLPKKNVRNIGFISVRIVFWSQYPILTCEKNFVHCFFFVLVHNLTFKSCRCTQKWYILSLVTKYLFNWFKLVELKWYSLANYLKSLFFTSMSQYPQCRST